MIENVVKIKSGIMINVDVGVKIQGNVFAKNIIFGIPVHVFVKMANI